MIESDDDRTAAFDFTQSVTRTSTIMESPPRNNGNYSLLLTELLTSREQATQRRDSLYIVIPITVIYITIFFTGLIGNVSTCVVIARNRSMHTATNYYLFSLAVSDLLLLVSGLPPEMYYIWSHFPYVFGEAFCIIQSFAAETSANATVLTITAFTIERYVAICHPFLSHTMSKLSRAVKYVVMIWFLALCLAVPQAIQFGIVYSAEMNGTLVPDTAICSVKWAIIEHAFEVSTILFFVTPMTVITVLYILIGIELRHSRLLTMVKSNPTGCLNHIDSGRSRGLAQRNVIRMLVAVVVAFFICWAPFHAQRLLAVYAQSTHDTPHGLIVTVYTVLTYISGIFYYVSTTVNPLLYNIMSNKFREAFKTMLAAHCGRRSLQKKCTRHKTYSSLCRHTKTIRQQSASSASDDTQQLTTPQTFTKTFDERRSIDTTKRTKSTHISRSIMLPSSTRDLNQPCDDNAEIFHTINKTISSNQNHIKLVVIGSLAERLRFRTKELFSAHQQHQDSSTNVEVDKRLNGQPRLQSHLSVESSNTVRDPILQDFDTSDFTEAELAQYMGEFNHVI